MKEIKDVLSGLKTAITAQPAESKANEVTHTGNTGFGAELIPTNVQGEGFIDMIPEYSRLLQAFTGDQGNNLPSSSVLPVIGEMGLYDVDTEWTTGGILSKVGQGTEKLPTGKVTLTMFKYKATADVSDEQLRFSSVEDLEGKVKERMLKAAGRTVDAAIINGDPTTAGTGNVNSDDGAPASNAYYLGGTGLRKVGILTNTDELQTVGTLDWATFVEMQTEMNDLAANEDDILWITNRRTHNKAMTLEEFKDAAKNGADSTINSLAKTNILGADLFIARDLPLTEADGKVSTTASNNTKGQIILAHKSAVQYGFNGQFTIEPVRVPGTGFQLIGYFYFAYAIANKLAGQTDPSVVAGINVTV